MPASLFIFEIYFFYFIGSQPEGNLPQKGWCLKSYHDPNEISFELWLVVECSWSFGGSLMK